MNDITGNTPIDGNTFESANGVTFELSGYRLEGDEWRDVEKGAPLPSGAEWSEVELVTINLAPESKDGFYRSFDIFDGFDELYTISDLADEAADAYGFTPA